MLLEKISFLNLLSHNTIKIAKHFKGSNIKLILSKASHSKNLNKEKAVLKEDILIYPEIINLLLSLQEREYIQPSSNLSKMEAFNALKYK